MSKFRKLFNPILVIKKIRYTSTFLFVCGIIAVIYVFYRIVLIVYPINLMANAINDSKNKDSIICDVEVEPYTSGNPPILSESYMNRVSGQDKLSDNLVTNPKIAEINDNSNQPIGYYRSIENSTSDYKLLKDTDNTNFLRVTSTADSSYTDVLPHWVLKDVNIDDGSSYSYGFKYRSNIEIGVAIEYFKVGSKEPSNINVTKLVPSSEWKSFNAHYNPVDGASSFRVAVYGITHGQVDTKDFGVYKIKNADLNTGIVSVVFDGGWKSTDSIALDLLNKYHIRTTQYVTAGATVENYHDYMSFSDLRKLQQLGHEIGSHTYSGCSQTNLGHDEIVDDAVLSQKILENNNLGSVELFSYPSGAYNDMTQAIYAKNYSILRTNDFGYNDKYYDETNIRSISVLSSTEDTELSSWLEYARKNNLWLVLVYHRIDETGEYGFSKSDFANQLKIIYGSGLIIMPVGEAASLIRV